MNFRILVLILLFICLFVSFCSLAAYWGRDSNAAAASQLFGSPFGAAAAGLGLLPGTGGGAGSSGGGNSGGAGSSSGGGGSNNDRYSMNNHQHHQNTMAVAASQAASLAGLHPASKYKADSINIKWTKRPRLTHVKSAF